jgi:protein-S-isoprenylcysteine O-methyltransferase Ste14
MIPDIRLRVTRAIGPDRRWVIPQLIGIGVIILAIPLESLRGRRRSNGRTRMIALPLLLASAWLASRAKSDLSHCFTMSPTPVADGALIERGVYGTIRHPMYLSVLLFVAGYATAWWSRFGLVCLCGSASFLIAKVRHEERALTARYDSYPEYCDRVRWRLLPGIL